MKSAPGKIGADPPVVQRGAQKGSAHGFPIQAIVVKMTGLIPGKYGHITFSLIDISSGLNSSFDQNVVVGRNISLPDKLYGITFSRIGEEIYFPGKYVGIAIDEFTVDSCPSHRLID